VVIAGLTGGIASGKSTVAGFLADAGAQIIDADQIAREVVRKGTPAYQEILSLFGRSILRPNGEIDRKHLGNLIFNDSRQKARLDAIVHPYVFRRMRELINQTVVRLPQAVVILDIPLLLEAGMQNDLQEIIVVYIPECLQLKRLMIRDGIDEKAAMARIRSQLPIEEKRSRATIVIDNSGELAESQRQALAVYHRLKQQADDFDR
jgi:dephospho-CoA kinase